MLGVIVDAAEHDIVREFFELFKTPWEFFQEGRQYDVVLCAGDCRVGAKAKLTVVYAGTKTLFDEEERIEIASEDKTPCVLSRDGEGIPVYGRHITFATKTGCLLKSLESEECVGFVEAIGQNRRARIGYDLFREVRTLLTNGQPVDNAGIPTLELHISFLRDLIAGCGISLVEIPPIPEGFQFIACLTHDVDHPSIRRHKWDHTMFGFLYRATLASLRKFTQGQISFGDLLTNWLAAFKLPFVYLGFAKDFWLAFADCYQSIEREFRSTFFVIPYKNRPGRAANGSAPSFRGSGYGAEDLADVIQKLVSTGHEVGLHGIDAWTDSAAGSEELHEIQRLTGISATGARMHWLYYDLNTPRTLESAGAAYDSTFGYNETVGYRAGTTQVFKPLETAQLLELPLHVMDTALFYPSRLELSPKQAVPVLAQMQDNAVRFGGVLTINWHDRSVAPERLWGGSYRDLIQQLKSRGAWFATAGQAVSWFRKRRSATFETTADGLPAVNINFTGNGVESLPGLRLRLHQADLLKTEAWRGSTKCVDLPLSKQVAAGSFTGADS